MAKLNQLTQAIVWSPVLWGLFATLGFYAPIHGGQWTDPFVVRYFAGHPVEHVAMAMFFIGLAALAIKLIGVVRQLRLTSGPVWEHSDSRPERIERATAYLEQIARLPVGVQQTYLVRRLREALEHVHRKTSADTIDDQLRYLSDLDAVRMQNSYSLVRIIIWAIPILGLLGTVIGITAAVANLSPESLAGSVSQVTAGLGVAFDHTALALALSIGLMFSQFAVERVEQSLLSAVDDRVAAELVGRFEESVGDPQAAVSRRAADTMAQAAEQLVVRQAELWQRSISVAHEHWKQTMAGVANSLEPALAAGLTRALGEHARALAESEAAHAAKNHAHWDHVQRALSHCADAATAQQQELARQGDVLLKLVDATGQVTRLEGELNSNLASLATTRHFDETMTALAAAVSLLIARLGQLPGETHSVNLRAQPRTGQAA